MVVSAAGERDFRHNVIQRACLSLVQSLQCTCTRTRAVAAMQWLTAAVRFKDESTASVSQRDRRSQSHPSRDHTVIVRW